MLSSIFSSKSIQGFGPKLPAAALAAVAVVLLVEGGMRVLPDRFVMKSGGWLGELYYAEQVVLPRSPQPQVVFMGSSTAQIALVPTAMEQELGAPAGAVSNLAIRGGRPFDALTLYRRQRPTLGKAKVLVLALNTWTFNASYAPTARYRLHAPFEERLAFADGVAFVGTATEADDKRRRAVVDNTRQRLLIDSVFTLRVLAPYAMRSATHALHLRKERKWPQLAADGRMQVGRWVPRGPESTPEQIEVYEVLAAQRCSDYAVQPIFVEHVRELARLCEQDGVKLVLIQLPCRDAYQDAVEARFAGAARAHRATCEALAKELNVPFESWTRPADVGIDGDTGFQDYGHMAGDGAQAFTAFLARYLKRTGMLGE